VILRADARAIPLRDESVQCCVTSPPYWGLRDYGTPGQLGLEKTPEEYVANMVAVFREVRRVLKDDGVLWLNLGDSYAGNRSYQVPDSKHKDVGNSRGMTVSRRRDNAPCPRSDMLVPGLKPKDLVGIPWRVAFALQQPYYTGCIRKIEDRIWLAAMLDAEGCLFIHRRKAGQHNGQGYYRKNDNYGPGVEIANTSLPVVERIMALVGKGSICSQGPDQTGGRRKQTIYRWNLRTTESKDFVRELYPYLIAKKQQARILYGCPSSGERATAAHLALIALHRKGVSDVDFPEPPHMLEPGWYLRSDVIWAKYNPMPESVTDRPTKAHEYIFLMSKSAKYYYDQGAIKEPASGCSPHDLTGSGYSAPGQTHQNGNRAHARTSKRVPSGWDTGPSNHHGLSGRYAQRAPGVTPKSAEPGSGIKANSSFHAAVCSLVDMRNKRSVWSIATQPYSGSHFATFPEEIPRLCILAGSRPGDVILDPFGGSGTVAKVALNLGRKPVHIDLTYHELARKRMTTTPAMAGLM